MAFENPLDIFGAVFVFIHKAQSAFLLDHFLCCAHENLQLYINSKGP